MSTPFESLEVWQLSHQLALQLYQLSRSFPRYEQFGLTSQLRRAAMAIPTNIAEGNARGSVREYLYFCKIGRGSLAEVRYLLRFSRDLELLTEKQFEDFRTGYDRVGKMLHYLMKALLTDRVKVT
jgi:four helix bundle protein